MSSILNLSTISERTSARLSIEWFDHDGEPAIPSSITYRIDCLTTGEAVLASTALTPAAEVEIALSSAHNAMRNPAHATERRLITISATYGAGDEIHIEHEYSVANLRFVA